MKTETERPRPCGIGLTAHQPPAKTNGEERIGKPNTRKTNIKMYSRKETLQEAPQNKRKKSCGPGPMEQRGKTTIAGVPQGIPQTYQPRGKMRQRQTAR